MKTPFGHPLVLATWKGRIHPAFESPAFVETLKDPARLLNSPGSRILLDGRNRVGTVSISLDETTMKEVVVKEFSSFGIDRLKSAILPSKAQKAWRGSAALVEKKILTPLPIAFLEKRGRFSVEKSYFLCEWIHDAEEVRGLFRRTPPEKLHTLLEELARHLYTCHSRGILHRDLSDGNIMARESPEGRWEFYLLDTNRIRLKRKIGSCQSMKNLIRLGIHPDYQHFFLERYFDLLRIPRRLWFWYKINKFFYTSYVGLKRVLGLKRLAQKLKIQ